MKIIRVLTVLLLTALTAYGWFSMISTGGIMAAGQSDKERTLKIETAEDYAERGLYQKAISVYEDIAANGGRAEDWERLLDLYQLRYEEDEHIRNDFIETAKRAVRRYPSDVSMCTKLIKLCVQYGQYSTAYQYAKMTKTAGGSGEEFDRLFIDVAFSFTGSDAVFTAADSPVNKFYAVREGDYWGLIRTNGKNYCARKYLFVSSVGQDGIYVRCDGDENILIDDDDIIQGKLSFVPDEAGVLSEDLIPLRQGDRFAYYTVLGDKAFGSYEEAGTFSEGKAAVKKNGSWVLVDSEGREASPAYEEIVISSDGTWNHDDVMIASSGGVYNLYSTQGRQIGNLNAEDMDGSESGLIAYKSGGKWGYANKKGESVIPPAFEEARSFSGGLAAVKIGEYWGFINMEGQTVIQPQFSETGYFSKEGSCMVRNKSANWSLIILNNPEVLK